MPDKCRIRNDYRVKPTERCPDLSGGVVVSGLMCNQDEFVLTLMKAKKHDPAAYPETFHVGFYVGAPTPCKPSMMNFRKPAFLRERFSTRAEAAAASPPSIATLRAVS